MSPAKRKVLKALVKGSLLLPYHAASAATAASSQSNRSFRFASAYSATKTLSSAVVNCVKSVRKQLGPNRPPHLCQLFVTSDTHGSSIEHAPSCVRAYLSSKEVEPPVVIGGAVQALAHKNSHVAGVSLFAAHMPGVELMPFHATSESLPDLTETQWTDLMKATMTGRDGTEKVCAVVLAEPHFTQSHELIPRIRGALAGCPLMSGVLDVAAWGTHPWGARRSLRGAVFLNNKVHDHGAVGCLMKGPLQMDVICEQNCRPVGRIATVTESVGNTIVCLDDDQALHTMQRMVGALPSTDRKMVEGALPMIGVDVTGTGAGFVSCWCPVQSPASQEAHALEVAFSDVPEGSLVQLQLPDPDGSLKRLQAQLQGYVGDLPPEAVKDPAQLGSLLFSCGNLKSSDINAAQKALQGAPVQGAHFLAQFAPVIGSPIKQSLVQAQSRAFGLLRQLQA